MDQYYLKRLRLLIATIIAAVVFRWIGNAFGIPDHAAGFGGSVIARSGGIGSLIIIGIAFCGLTALTTAIVGSIRADAAVFCVAIGLAALALRAGDTRYTLFGQSSAIWIKLAIELLLLGVIVALAWLITFAIRRAGLVPDDADAAFDESGSLNDQVLAVAIHAFAMLAMLSILCRSDQRWQCLLSVGVAAWIASVVAHMVAPSRPSIWYFASPILVGAIAYIWTSFSTQDLPIGQPNGYFAALARPLPLDYASGGVAGAMLGYWVARGWNKGDAAETTQEVATA